MDGVMAKIDLACGPYRIVSLMSREAAEELDLKPGDSATAVVKCTPSSSSPADARQPEESNTTDGVGTAVRAGLGVEIGRRTGVAVGAAVGAAVGKGVAVGAGRAVGTAVATKDAGALVAAGRGRA